MSDKASGGKQSNLQASLKHEPLGGVQVLTGMLLGVCVAIGERENRDRDRETGGRKTLILGQQGSWSSIRTPNSMPISTSTPLRGLCSKETFVKLLGLPPEV